MQEKQRLLCYPLQYDTMPDIEINHTNQNRQAKKKNHKQKHNCIMTDNKQVNDVVVRCQIHHGGDAEALTVGIWGTGDFLQNY